jgi:hypothetical protein
LDFVAFRQTTPSLFHNSIFAGLKQFLAISLLSLFLVSTTELYQLVKLPMLIEHFKEHKEEDKRMTLWTFLCIHYDFDVKKDEDYAKDIKLPFKSNDSLVNTVAIDFVSHSFQAISSKIIYSSAARIRQSDETYLPTSFLSSIWQPPKSC